MTIFLFSRNFNSLTKTTRSAIVSRFVVAIGIGKKKIKTRKSEVCLISYEGLKMAAGHDVERSQGIGRGR